MSGQPYLKFFPTDWRADPAVRICSLAARGLWFEMLCLMHEAGGFLRIGSNPITPEQLARLTGSVTEDVVTLIAEMEKASVFSRDADGSIYCRRMLRDIKRAAMADPTAAERMRRYRNRRRNGQSPQAPDTSGKKGGVTGNRNEKSVTNVTRVTPMARVQSQTFSIEKEESLTTARNGAAGGCALLGAASPPVDDDQKAIELQDLRRQIEVRFAGQQRLRILAKLDCAADPVAYGYRCLADKQHREQYKIDRKPYPPRPATIEDPEMVEIRALVAAHNRRHAS